MALAGAPGAAELERVELQLWYVDIEFQSLWPKFKLDSYGEPPHHQTQWPFSIANASIAREYSALIGALLHEVTLKSHFFRSCRWLILHLFLRVRCASHTLGAPGAAACVLWDCRWMIIVDQPIISIPV